MYSLTVMRKTKADRTEQDFYYATKAEALAKIVEMAQVEIADEAQNPTEETMDFKLNPHRGTLPVDVEV